MSLSFDLYYAMKQFDDNRRERREKYLSRMKAIEGYKGSEGYTAEKKKAIEERQKADDIEREKCKQVVRDCLMQMRKNASKMPLTPPTAEQLAILQTLSLKKNLTRQELDRASVSMNGNSLALSALNDIADRFFNADNPDIHKRSHTNYLTLSAELSNEATETIINSIERYCNDVLRSPVKHTALIGADFNRNKHGTAVDYDALPQRMPMISESSFYDNVVPQSGYNEFMKAVNG